MSKLTTKEYVKLTKALTKKGFSVDTEENSEVLFKALKKANFEIELKGKLYSNIYASRIIAMMHEGIKGEGKPLVL